MSKFVLLVEETYCQKVIVEAEDFSQALEVVDQAVASGDLDIAHPDYYCDTVYNETPEYGEYPLTDEEFEREKRFCTCLSAEP